MSRTVVQATGVRQQGSPVAHLVEEDGQAYTLYFTSESASYSGLGWTYAQIPRQGRKPLVRRDAQEVRVLSFSHVVTPGASDELGRAPNAALEGLMWIAETGRKMRLINVSETIETRGWWYVSLSVKITERDANQQVRRATCDWTLTEANDERPLIARVPPPPPPPPPPAVASPPASMQGDYTVVAGDSLWRIASRLLGNGTRWTELYDLNQARLNLAPPEMYKGLLTVWIYASQVLQIPAR